jgi:hypothetical protein
MSADELKIHMIEKPAILVTSTGRTGTEFFSKLFASIVPDCTSLHEPNTIVLPTDKAKLEHYVQQIRRAGIWRMVFLKAVGQWHLAKLSDARFSGKLSYPQAVSNLSGQRMSFASEMPGSVYIEANLGYYGLLDVIPAVFKHHKEIYIVRDGRNWVRSMLNWGEVYGKKGIRKYFSHQWPAASDIPEDPYAEKWHGFSRFEKLCWAWAKLNGYALDSISKNPHVRVFHFEKIFSGKERYQYLNDLVTFATSLPGIDPERIGRTDGWLEQKIHQSSNEFPAWEKWTPEQRRQFEQMCGPLMEKLGYTLE